jgi:hypothetical protein
LLGRLSLCLGLAAITCIPVIVRPTLMPTVAIVITVTMIFPITMARRVDRQYHTTAQDCGQTGQHQKAFHCFLLLR